MTIDPESFTPESFAKLVRETPDGQLAEILNGDGVRELMLDEVFGQMEDHFDSQRAGSTDAVVEWRISGRADGGHDRFQVHIASGSCRAEKGGSAHPRVSFELDPVPFVKLVTGNAQGPVLFMTGQLKIDGDLMFAAQVADLFKIPTA